VIITSVLFIVLSWEAKCWYVAENFQCWTLIQSNLDYQLYGKSVDMAVQEEPFVVDTKDVRGANKGSNAF